MQLAMKLRDLIRELLEFVDDVIHDLHPRKEIRHIHTILERGTSADDQLRVWRETSDIKAVVDRLIEMTMENVPREVIPLPNDSESGPIIGHLRTWKTATRCIVPAIR